MSRNNTAKKNNVPAPIRNSDIKWNLMSGFFS